MKSGQRTDLVGFVADCKALAVAPSEEATEQFEMKHLGIQAKYPRFYEKYIGKYERKREWKTRVIVLWGEPGTGKTRFAYYMFEQFAKRNQETKQEVYNMTSYPVSRNSHIAWFVGYDQHKLCLFDEYEGQYGLSLFKELTGDMPCKVKIGNGQSERQWVPDLLVICSNSDPVSWYGTRNDVLRRFSAVVHVDYHPDYPLDTSKGPAYALDVVRHSFISIDSAEYGRSIADEWAAFQAQVPVIMSDVSPPSPAPILAVKPESPILIGSQASPIVLDE